MTPSDTPASAVKGEGAFEARAVMLTKKHGDPCGTDYEQGQNDMGHRMVTLAREADAAILAILQPHPSQQAGTEATEADIATLKRIIGIEYYAGSDEFARALERLLAALTSEAKG